MAIELIFRRGKNQRMTYRTRHRLIKSLISSRGRFFSLGYMFDGVSRGFIPKIEVPLGVIDLFLSDYRMLVSGEKARYLSPRNLVFDDELFLTVVRIGGGHGFLLRSSKDGLDMGATLRFDERMLGLLGGDDTGLRKNERQYLYRFKCPRLGLYLEQEYRSDPDTHAVLFFLSEPNVIEGEIIYKVVEVKELVGRGIDDPFASAIRSSRPSGESSSYDDVFIDLDKGIVL